MNILNVIYLPDQDCSSFSPNIAPDNTFCFVLSQFFGNDYDLLEDKSYFSYREDKMKYFPVKDTSPLCLQRYLSD